MPEVNVPIGTPVVKNIDGSLLDDSSSRLIDGYLDEEGNINSRPGLLLFANLTTGVQVDGIFWWDEGGKVIAIADGNVLILNFDATTSNLGSAASTMTIGTRPTFATDGTSVYIANGGRIVKTDGATVFGTLYVADADAPTAVTHIIFIDGYLIANSIGSDTFYWADVNAPDTWSALSFASAEGAPDEIVAIHNFQREIYIFGKTSFELWENDGDTPFSRIPGGFRNTGCIAPYSVVSTENGVIWLSNKKRFVRYGGSGIEQISTAYDKEIDSFDTVSDCIADRVDIAGRSFYYFTFPSEERTLVYNETNQNWAEAGYWNATLGEHERFIGNCHCFSPTWDKHFWGTSKTGGAVYLMSPDYFNDDGNPLRMQKITGHISYGTNKMKRNEYLTIRARRGRILDSSEPVMMLRYKNDETDWSNEIHLSLGAVGDYRNMIKINRMGIYRTRQYEFTVTDNIGVAFGGAKEEVTILGR